MISLNAHHLATLPSRTLALIENHGMVKLRSDSRQDRKKEEVRRDSKVER